jgi:hypothetical protein
LSSHFFGFSISYLASTPEQFKIGGDREALASRAADRGEYRQAAVQRAPSSTTSCRNW